MLAGGMLVLRLVWAAGSCAAVVQYGQLTPNEKSLRALECGTPFPCLGEKKVPDYTRLCPQSWTEGIDNMCLAPAEYEGPCLGRKSFVDATISGKIAWGMACGVAWPTRLPRPRSLGLGSGLFFSDCIEDYTQACPDRFSLEGRLCKAPADFRGTCAYTLDAFKYNAKQKAAYAMACSAPWPCKAEPVFG